LGFKSVEQVQQWPWVRPPPSNRATLYNPNDVRSHLTHRVMKYKPGYYWCYGRTNLPQVVKIPYFTNGSKQELWFTGSRIPLTIEEASKSVDFKLVGPIEPPKDKT
jgi:hypothetical protein